MHLIQNHNCLFYCHVWQKHAARIAVVRGCHKYENVWSASIDGTQLLVERESNPGDALAVASCG